MISRLLRHRALLGSLLAFLPYREWQKTRTKEGWRSEGRGTTWITPVNVNDLLELKTRFLKPPIIMGATAVGRWSRDMFFLV